MSLKESKDLKEFSEWILRVRDGKLSEPNDCEAEKQWAQLFMAIQRYWMKTKKKLFFQERAILCPTNEDVNIVNDYMLDKLDSKRFIIVLIILIIVL